MIDFNEFCKIIKSLDDNMSIGIHGIGNNRIEKNNDLSIDEIGSKITNTGLELHGWGGLLSSVKMFGRVKDLDKNDLQRIYNYIWQFGNNGEIVNILFGFPEIITNSEGNEFYLGYYNQDNVVGFAKGHDQAGDNLPLNKLFEHLKLIPNDFIIGCIKSKQNNPNSEFKINRNFYWFQNNQAFYDKLYNLLENANIINPIYYVKYQNLYAKYNMSGLLLKQYKEYLSNHNEIKNSYH